MLGLIKFLLSKFDLPAISEFLRKRNNRAIASRLCVILIKSYEVEELYRSILGELESSLENQSGLDGKIRSQLSPSRIAYLLTSQARNLESLESLIYSVIGELRLIDNTFSEKYRSLVGGKAGILLDAQILLHGGRLSLVETGPEQFPMDTKNTCRTLWFSDDPPDGDRADIEKYLYGWDGREKVIVDVNFYDGKAFFNELKHYFETQNPHELLSEIHELNENYKRSLIAHFSIEDLLTDIGKVQQTLRQ